MKNCIKCGKPLPMEDALYCCYCGKKQNIKVKAKKTRGNGEGSVYKQPNGKWTVEVTCLLYTQPSPRDRSVFRMTSSACK